MSIKTLDWAFDLKIDNPGAKLVLIALANYDNSEGGSFPSIAKIEEVTSIKPRTIATHLKYLEEVGIIRRHERFKANGGRASSLYEFCNGVAHPPAESAGGPTAESGTPLLNRQYPPAESAGVSYPPDYPEETLLRKEASPVLPAKKEKPPANAVWTDFKALLILQGNTAAGAGGMIGKLIKSYGAERVDRVFEANRDLICEQAEAYGYFVEILKRDKTLNKDEAELQQALKDARYYHNSLHSGAEFTPAFDANKYLTRWPVLGRYVDEIASGVRPDPDKKARLDEQKFNESVLEQARFYGRIPVTPTGPGR